MPMPLPFVDRSSSALPVQFVSPPKWRSWLKEQSAARRGWLVSLGIVSKAGDFAVLPGRDGKAAGAVLVLSSEPSLWDFGALATRLQRANHQLSCEFSVRVKALLGPDQLAGVSSGKLDRSARMQVEGVSSSEADLEGSNRWYSITVRGASGKDIRQLFERQGVLVSRILRVSMGDVKLDKSLLRGQFRQLEAEEIEGLLHPKPQADNAA